MTDDRHPRIPSFDELGIDEDEIEELERDLASDAEGGESPRGAEASRSSPADAPAAPAAPGGGPADPRAGGRARRDPPESGGDGPARAPARPRRGLRGPITLVVLLVLAWLSRSGAVVPAPVPAGAPDTAFSSGRAMAHVARLAARARPVGSPAHAAARRYLLAELRALGHDPKVHASVGFSDGGDALTVARIHNVVARIPGTEPGGPAVLVTAHYDSRGISPGAGDDALGVAAILESLRALSARPPLRNDLIVLLSDGEEIGLLGARAFVAEHPWMDDAALVLALEMRGGGGAAWMFETGPENGWVVEALREADPHPLANSAAIEIYQRMPNDTDFTPFRAAGRAGLNFAAVGRPAVYHQAYDTPANVSEATLQHHGARTLALLDHFGRRDLAIVHAPDLSYTSVNGLGLVTYGRGWIRGLGAAAAALWALAFAAARRRGSTLGRVLATAGLSLVCAAVVALAAGWLHAWRVPAHWEAGALQAGTFHSEGWHVAAVVAFAFAAVSGAVGILRRWFTTLELSVGALLAPTLLAALAAAAAPMAAQNLQWPALAGCVAALAVAGSRRDAPLAHWRWLVAALAIAPAFAVLVPLAEGIWLAAGFRLAPAIAVAVVFPLLVATPLIDAMREPNGWWAPTVGAAAAAAALAMGVRASAPSPERPAPSTLVYALDRESGSAHWGGDAEREAPDPGVAWADRTARALRPEPGAGGETDAAGPVPEALAELNARGVRYAWTPAVVHDAPPPTVAALPGSAGAGAGGPDRPLRVAVSSSIGAEATLFRFGDLDERGVRLVAVDGESPPDGASLRGRPLRHWGAMGDAVVLDFRLDARAGAFEFVVVEHHLRPGELLGPDPFERPPELAPNVTTLSDRAMIRSRVRVDPARMEARVVRASDPVPGPATPTGSDAEREPVPDSTSREGENGASRVDAAPRRPDARGTAGS